MKIVIISDTHIPRRARGLPKPLVDALKTSDLVIHAGDWQTLDVYEELRQFAPVEGVAGNVDGKEIIHKFGRKKLLVCKGIKIGLVHGDGKGKTTEERAFEAFQDDEVEIIIFGHSHIPLKKEQNGITLFNPGSPTDKRRQSHYSFGILTIDKEIRLEHVYYEVKKGFKDKSN